MSSSSSADAARSTREREEQPHQHPKDPTSHEDDRHDDEGDSVVGVSPRKAKKL